MKLLNFKSALALANSLYDVAPSETDFEDIGLNAWELINNKHTRLYRYKADTKNKQLELPCNVDILESVSIAFPEAQLTDTRTNYISHDNIIAEAYNDALADNDLYNSKGSLIKYKELNNVLYFNRDYHDVIVIYHGVAVDDEGLPLINDKEMRAIAAYVGYSSLYKEAIRKRDGNLLKLAQVVNADWLKYCNAARIPTHFTQNDMDRILDVKTRWDRKQYGKSIKPIL